MTFEQKLIQLLQATAIKMDAPVVYGAFHFAIVAVMIVAAVAGALLVRKRDEKVRIRILALSGWFLMGIFPHSRSPRLRFCGKSQS